MTAATAAAQAQLTRWEAGLPFRFAVNTGSRRVHVVRAGIPWQDPPPSARIPPTREDLGNAVLDFMMGRLDMVCGVVLYQHRGGLEHCAHLVETFDDDDLCHRCHAAFGDQAWLIFAHNPQDKES